MKYPIVIHKEDGSDYGIIVPDLPGCFSASDTLDDAMNQAREAIECHLEGMLADHEAIPAPGSLDLHQANPDYTGGIWALVEIDLARLRSTTKRYNISMSERVMAMVDVAASQSGESRSAYLAKAAVMRVESGWMIAPANDLVEMQSSNDDRALRHRA